MKIFKYSNIGNREENQDYLASVKLGQDRNLFLVADGMGGYDCGDIASKVVGDSYIWALSRNLSVEEATIQASENLNKEKHNLGIAKMGSTIAAVLLEGRLATIFWAGDSRVYVFRNHEQPRRAVAEARNRQGPDDGQNQSRAPGCGGVP